MAILSLSQEDKDRMINEIILAAYLGGLRSGEIVHVNETFVSSSSVSGGEPTNSSNTQPTTSEPAVVLVVLVILDPLSVGSIRAARVAGIADTFPISGGL